MTLRTFRQQVETLNQRVPGITQAFYYRQLPSTQTDAVGRGKLGAPACTLILADQQTEGRGRMSRHWESPFGKGLYFSLLLRPAIKTAQAPLITLAAGLGIARSLREMGAGELMVKWPNDLMVGQKKLGGILTEMVQKKDEVDFVAIGVGLNVLTEPADFSAETGAVATSLKQVRDQAWDRGEILERILAGLGNEVQLLAERGPAELVRCWETESGMIGKRIRVTREGKELEGEVLGLGEDGQLKMQTSSEGVLRLLAEDTTLCS